MNRVPVVESLRGYAAVAVMWFHFTNGNPAFLPDGWLKASGSFGGLGVHVFFVISGFVIPLSLQAGGFRLCRDFPAFMAKRLIRLEPPYLVAVLACIFLAYLSARMPWYRGGPPDVTVTQALLHIGYAAPFFGHSWLNPVFWSLAIELQFYVLAALASPWLADRRAGWLALAALCALGLLVPEPLLVFRYSGLFALGIVALWAFTDRVGRGEFVAAAALLAAVTSFSLGAASAIAGLATAVVIVFVRSLPGAALGAISYSLYLLHVPVGGRVINLGSHFETGIAIKLAILAAAIALSVGCALALYRWIELPSRRWAGKIRYGGRILGASAPRLYPDIEESLEAVDRTK